MRATCQHNRPWWDDGCLRCKAAREDALVVVDRAPNYHPIVETWRVRGEVPFRHFYDGWRLDQFVAACLEAEERMVASGVDALRKGIWGDGT